jgi:hypothetical protein
MGIVGKSPGSGHQPVDIERYGGADSHTDPPCTDIRLVIMIQYQQAGSFGWDIPTVYDSGLVVEVSDTVKGVIPKRAGPEQDGIPYELKSDFPGKGIARWQ